MTAFEADRLHASDETRKARANRLEEIFDLYLRGVSPALASMLSVTAGGEAAAAGTIVTAILAIADRAVASHAIAEFDRMRQVGRASPRNDALVGHALIAALQDVLGPAFDEATREAWANGYIRLVESVMAARRNRLDCVA